MQQIKETIVLAATDLGNHLACRHLTRLNALAATGDLKKPIRKDVILDTLIERGLEHERAYVEHLRTLGKSVSAVEKGIGRDQAREETIAAMQNGVDVIVQGVLSDERWRGLPDLLLRVDTPSDFGEWSYEVADTKLSQNTKGGTVLQLCLYAELLGKVQGVVPATMTVVKPGDPFGEERFRVDDFMAYYRLVKHNLEESITLTSSFTYPNPVPHCDICNWWSVCNQKRRDDDHLSFVAGIGKHQIAELNRQGTATLTEFAEADDPLSEPPQRGSIEAYENVHLQARIQHRGRTEGKLAYEFLELEDRRGFLKLPEPDTGDVFFDIEGDPHVAGGGLEYLLGYVVKDEDGNSEYKAHWSLGESAEKSAFEQFVDYLTNRWKAFPGMHVYHYAHYEPSAMKRLAMQHATREDEVDRLLRAKRFIDLYAVVRQGIRASVESYSIKKLEPFYGFTRAADLEDARYSLHRVERALELGRAAEIQGEDKATVTAYNKDDCLSTMDLRTWLEGLRDQLVAQGNDMPRPELLDGDASDAIQERNDEVTQVFNQLVDCLPETDRNAHEDARWLLAHLLDYFRREDKCVWWEYFRMRDLQPDELLLEKTGLTGLQFESQVPGGPRDRNPTHRYRFPLQEAHFDVGDTLVEVNGEGVGSVAFFDLRAGIIDIKKKGTAVDVHPSEIFIFDRIRPEPLPDSLLEFGRSVVQTIDAPAHTARYAMLSKQAPRLKTLQLPLDGDVKDVAVQLACDLDNSVLAIQGPPGAGKTYIGSHMIAELSAAGKRIGITAISHKVIANLLEAVLDRDEQLKMAQRISSPPNDHPQAIEVLKRTNDVLPALLQGKVVGGTAWLWANATMEQQVDYLFVDEAGQMSLAIALGAGRAAKNIVLLGDPQQLEQPQLGSHPEGAEVAALTHLLEGRDTIADTKGLFVPKTWRLNPSICTFTSEQYYEGRLSSREGLECQIVTGSPMFPEAGLAFVPVTHEGNQSRSLEEAEAIALIFESLLDGHHKWYNSENIEADLTINDVVVVAPYNAQVAQLQNRLPNGARVGTVDKFQGQEAAVVIYSVTSSSVEDAPRGMSFLYSPNRMNVATSRARCLVIVVGSPDLFHPECATPQHIRLANGFCRFSEMARHVEVT